MDKNQQEAFMHFLQNTAAASHWNSIGVKHHHGISVPLFSLHTSESAGIGEYPDLIPLITWCQNLGLDTLQLLPLNDTGPNRSPYSAISAYALNPLHLGLSSLPGLKDNFKLNIALKELQQLTALPRVDYAKIQGLREHLLKNYFKEHASTFVSFSEYQNFLKQHSWLKDYALFKSIKSHCNWNSWASWPEDVRTRLPSAMNELYNKFETDIDYHTFVQFLCFEQMKQVKKHAEDCGVFLKGDIPILIDQESADMWIHPTLFNFELTAGAPPDMYSATGQNWGFPLYNWQEMEKTEFFWWKERLAVASNFYHIYRIDHIVGFFRIWAIAKDEPATQGHFIPENPQKALEQGDQLMRMMLEASTMLPIGEDLGKVPPEVRTHLQELGICGTKVMRWERYWDTTKAFIPPEKYAPLSVTTVSTHDSSTLQLWWTQDSHEAIEYCHGQGWEYSTPLPPEYHFSLLYNSHHTTSLFHINLLQEYLALFPELVHSTPEEERINIPGLISNVNWSYRFLPSAETIVTHSELAQLILDVKG